MHQQENGLIIPWAFAANVSMTAMFCSKVRRQVVPRLQIRRTIISDPNFSLIIFPNQNLERKIDRALLGAANINRSASLWVFQKLTAWSDAIFIPCLRPLLRCVIDQRETEAISFRLENSLELGDGFIHRVITRYID